MNDIVINTPLGLWIFIGLMFFWFVGGIVIGWFVRKEFVEHAKSEGGKNGN